MHILGLSAFYHDSAAAVIVDGKIVAAAQEERFTRRKHDQRFPARSLAYCLAEAGLKLEDINYVAFYDKPFLKFERLLETYVAFAPRGLRSFQRAMPIWIKEKLFQKDLLRAELEQIAPAVDWRSRLLFAEHHISHAASAYYPSPFDEAVVLTLDGVGEWCTTSAGIGRGNQLSLERELHFPHSLGLLYSAITYYTGFKVNSGEYKVMGLAPYGEPRYAATILDHIMDLKSDGSFRLDQSYFNYCTGLTMTSAKFAALFGEPVRAAEDRLTQFHMDMAASVQKVTEEVMLRLTRSLQAESGASNLCLAGGVALNCVANGKVLRDGKFKNIWIQPAAGDAGGALGAALSAYHGFLDRPRRPCRQAADGMLGAYLGPAFRQEEINRRLVEVGACFDTVDQTTMLSRTAQDLADGCAVGWFQGRMEFGPRALGARSILGDARSSSMQKTLNLRVKYRESFRPFAPSVLSEHASDWFEIDRASPYMLMVADVVEGRRRSMTNEEQARFGIDKLNAIRSEIPAVTHVDYSARIQTVHRDTNPTYHALIEQFHGLTGCPVIVNTSFNVRGEPIVCTPEDAFRCFMGTDIERLVIGNAMLRKEQQDPSLRQDYKARFELD
jgi:carbamoyltransferase